MGLEAATFISQLVAANPTGLDDYATADDHLRLIKSVLQSQFPNFTAVLLGATQAELDTLDGYTGTLADHNILSGAAAAGLTATELLFLNGVTSAIQAQIDGKAPTAHSHTGAEISALDAADTETGIFAAARIAAHTGDVTGLTALSIANDAVTYAKMQNIVADERLLGNVAGAGGIVAELTQAQVLTFLAIEAGATADQTAAEIEAIVDHDNLLGFLAIEHLDWSTFQGATKLHPSNSANNVLELTSTEVVQLAKIDGTVLDSADWVALALLSGTNTGDQTITLTGDVTGSGTGSFAATIANDAVTLAKMANMATASFLGRNTAATGDPEVLSATIARAILNVENNAAADQTAGEIEAIVNHDNLLGFVTAEHENASLLMHLAGNENVAGRKDFDGGVQVGTDTDVATVARILTKVDVRDLGTIGSLAKEVWTVTVTGAQTSDIAHVTADIATGGILLRARVSAANTVEIFAQNVSAGNVNWGSTNFRIIVFGV